MSKRAIKTTIEKIRRKEPINITKFKKLVHNLGSNISIEHDSLETVSLGKGKHLVKSYDESILLEIERFIDESSGDRVSSSRQNNSHSAKVNGSLVVVRKGLAQPGVVVFKDNDNFTQYRQSENALIIENKELFIHMEKTFSFLCAYCGFKKSVLESIDVILGDGRTITNSMHKQFLSNYNKVYMLPDLDLGGILIVKTIIGYLGEQKVEILMPNDIKRRLKQVRVKVNSEYISKVAKELAEAPKKLIPALNLIIQTQTTLEQESYLHGIDTKHINKS